MSAETKLIEPAAAGAPARRESQARLAPTRLLAQLADHCRTQATGKTALLVVSLNRSDRLAALAQDPSNQYVLAEIARRVQSVLRSPDRYAFVSNDELWLMLANLPDESLAELAGHTLRETLQHPVRAPRADGSHASVRLEPVIGGAWTALRTLADPMSMVTAASQSGVRARTVETRQLICRLDDDAALLKRNALEQDLRVALQANELDVHFQPQIDLASGRCVALEALIRWHRPDGSTVSPALIASVCEERGMMGELTRFVLNNALRCQKNWAGQGLDLAVSVNLSPTVLADSAFPLMVSHALATWDVPGDRLTLEFTESAIAQNEPAAIAFMAQLRKLGCRLALDDFGTGYSSLAWFGKLPLDELKIDRGFVREQEASTQDTPTPTVRGLIGLAHAHGLSVLAEAVESPRVAALLGAAGCDRAQGFNFSPALPPQAVAAWCQQHQEAGLLGRTEADATR